MAPPPPSPRKSRKKITGSSNSGQQRNDAVFVDPQTGTSSPAFPLAAFLWPARRPTSQWIILPLVLMAVGLFRWCVGLWGYSGFETPPMHGDYEAQRHWMEITSHLPISHWYFYDLEYWGLDYPPLTAYHSWALGKIGSFISPEWFALDSSRGIEEKLLKVYMRATVIVSEYLVYVPAIVILNRKTSQLHAVNKWERSIALVAVLMQPATILIDHGHFQYNTVMQGFVMASLASLISEKFVWASIFFVAALCFKQMSLYYAPAIFAYLLGSCLLPRVHISRFLGISVVTILSFALAFAPMLLGTLWDNQRGINPPLSFSDRQINPLMKTLTPYVNPSSFYYPALLQMTQILHRCFPFARGIFEDKVANIWCAIHTFHKLHLYPIPFLQRLSLYATLMSILPGCMIISLHLRKELLPWALASCSWGFFLFSFQVHEKSVLLPLLPMIILLNGENGLGSDLRAWVGWANMLGVWTLFPLLKRDDLRVPYFILSGLWGYLLALPPASYSLYIGTKAEKNGLQLQTKAVHLLFYTTMLVWHILEAFIPPPKAKPDFWVVLNVLVGTAGFIVCYLWTTWQLILRSGILDEYFAYRQDQDSKSPDERAKAIPLPRPWNTKPDATVPKTKAKEPTPQKVGRPPKSNGALSSAVDNARERSPRKVGRPKKNT